MLERALMPVLRQVGIAPDAISIVVDVKREDAITGVLSVASTPLPEVRVDVLDGRLTEQSIEMFGKVMAVELKKLERK